MRYLITLLCLLFTLPALAQDTCAGINCVCVPSYMHPVNVRFGPDEAYYDVLTTLAPGDCVDADSVYYNRYAYTYGTDTWNTSKSAAPVWSGRYPVWIEVTVWVQQGGYIRPKTGFIAEPFLVYDPCAVWWIAFTGYECHLT